MLLALHSEALAPRALAAAWTFDGAIALPLAAAAALYALGLNRLWTRAGAGRSIRHWQAVAFCAGWLVLVLALVSPVHALGEVLFSAHMVQHELMIAVAAPLLVLARPLVPLVWALPFEWRKRAGVIAHTQVVSRTWRVLTTPVAAWLLYAAALWAWHLPTLYQRTLSSELLHMLQHVTFLTTALLFWWALVHGRERRLGYGSAVLYVFTTALHSGGLGALLTFARQPWYPAYDGLTAPWGLTPLEDQQLAGVIMWVPAGLVYVIAALVLIAAWLREADRRVVRWQKSMVPHA